MLFAKVTAIDYETLPISNQFPYPKPICLSYSGSRGEGIVVGLSSIEQFLKELLSEKDHLIVAHNVKFETIVTEEWFPELRKLLWDSLYAKRWFCTVLYQQLINNVSKTKIEKKDLANLVNIYFKEDISETKSNKVFSWRLKYHILEDIPVDMWPQPAIDYSLNDSIWALKLYKKYMEIDSKLLYSDHVLSEFTLNLMGSTGMLVAKDRVELLEKELLDFLNPNYERLISNGYASRNKKTGKIKKQTGKLRSYIKENIPEVKTSPKGTIETKDEAMEFYLSQAPEDEILKTFKDIGEYEKAYTAFVSRLLEADPIIRTDYNAIVSSGRSSARTTKLYPSLNIQQMPRELSGVTWDIRNCFVAPESFKLCSIDYSALELMSTATQLKKVVGYSKMAEKLNMGDKPTDLHSVLGAKLMSMKLGRTVTYEEFKSRKKEKEFEKIRKVAKVVGLGKPGGIGRDVMRTQMALEGIFPKYKELHYADNPHEIDQLVIAYRAKYPNIRNKRLARDKWALVYDEVVEFDRGLQDLYPELRKFLRGYHEKYMTGEVKKVKNDFGEWEDEPVYRYNAFGSVRDWCTYTEFCNGFLMQSPGAVGAKRAVNWFVEKYYRHKDVVPLAFIHDEILFYVRDDENMWNYIEDVASIMCKAMALTLSSVRITLEASTMDYWSKSKTLEDRTYFLNVGSKEILRA